MSVTAHCEKCEGEHPTNECEHVFMAYDDAVKYLAAKDDIHTFLNPAANLIVGADWSRRELLAAMKKAQRIEVTGETAQAMKHGLAIRDGDDMLFIETIRRTDEAK